MRKWTQWLTAVCLLCSFRTAAQDSIGKDNFVFIDTTKQEYSTVERVEAAADSAVLAEDGEEEEEDARDLETKLRDGTIPHSQWDDQVPGEWSEGSQSRLSIRESGNETITGLRNMKALQYKKTAQAKPGWAVGLLNWILEHARLLQNILIGLLAALLLAIIIYIAQNNNLPVFRWRKKKTEEEVAANTEAGTLDYDAMALAAIGAGNFREAVRMRYLQALQTLENRSLITRGKDKTNMDYLRELQPTGWHKPFATLTLHYEYIWYGKVPLNNGQFSQLDQQFTAFKHSLS